MFVVKILLLVGLIRLLIATNKPMLCTGIYTGAAVAFALMFERPLLYILIATPISFGLAFLYFWLLDRYEETRWFYVVLIVGLVIGLV